MVRRDEIQIRDPFVVPVQEQKRYYLFGTTDVNCWRGPGEGFNCYMSEDLETWFGPYESFRPPSGFWADRNFWAPEVHRWHNRYTMFATFTTEGRRRGTQILVSDHVQGPYLPHAERPVTPADWECLDGTLYVEDDTPYMVFCHEWLQVQDGEICRVELSPDLKTAVGEPKVLFRASEAPWVPENDKGQYVTDGPFLYRASNGHLLMLWSSLAERGYANGIARSKSGTLDGPWSHDEEPLYADDGGHGMLFRRFDGQLVFTCHTPNRTPDERPIFLPVEDDNGTLRLVRS